MKRAKRQAPTCPKPRNPVARSPLLGKGHAHREGRKARRQRAKTEVARELARLDDD